MKSDRELEMHVVAPPSTRMSKESESKIARADSLEEVAAWARTIPAVIADRARTCC